MIDITAIHLKTLREASIGLLKAKTAYPVYFQTRFGIHTLGMKFPIDVLILDNEFIVVKMKQSLLPNALFFWSPNYNNVIELPEGTIRLKSIHLKDRVSITSSQ
jgi:uncharacterized membrane protein (UPF0127 family)